MKIALTRPNYHSHLITPPLGMGYVSSYLKVHGYSADIIDGLKLGLSLKGLTEKLLTYDIIGIYCLSAYFHQVVRLCGYLKREGKIIILAGPHVTALPQESLRYTGADYIVSGEGELSTKELLDALSSGMTDLNVPGVISRGKSYLERPFIEDLDELPFPDWFGIDPRSYPKAPHGAFVKKFPVAPVVSSRGCPFSCHFCASPSFWRRKIRYRSPENVVEEILYLKKNLGVREIHFEDDNLTLKESHISGICEEMLRIEVNLPWATPNGIRVDTINRELLKLMKISGCYSLAFGIESFNQELLDNIDKKNSLEKMKEAIILASEIGLITQAFIIFGLPGETKTTIQNTIKALKKLPLDKAQILLLDLLPGSELWKKKGKPGIHLRRKSYQEPVYLPEGLTSKELKFYRSYAFRTFHLRPKQLFTLLTLAKAEQIKYIIKRIFDFSIFN